MDLEVRGDNPRFENHNWDNDNLLRLQIPADIALSPTIQSLNSLSTQGAILSLMLMDFWNLVNSIKFVEHREL